MHSDEPQTTPGNPDTPQMSSPNNPGGFSTPDTRPFETSGTLATDTRPPEERTDNPTGEEARKEADRRRAEEARESQTRQGVVKENTES